MVRHDEEKTVQKFVSLGIITGNTTETLLRRFRGDKRGTTYRKGGFINQMENDVIENAVASTIQKLGIRMKIRFHFTSIPPIIFIVESRNLFTMIITSFTIAPTFTRRGFGENK